MLRSYFLICAIFCFIHAWIAFIRICLISRTFLYGSCDDAFLFNCHSTGVTWIAVLVFCNYKRTVIINTAHMSCVYFVFRFLYNYLYILYWFRKYLCNAYLTNAFIVCSMHRCLVGNRYFPLDIHRIWCWQLRKKMRLSRGSSLIRRLSQYTVNI